MRNYIKYIGKLPVMGAILLLLRDNPL